MNRQLPSRSVRNVSLDRFVWSYLADSQTKLNRTFRPQNWLAGIDGPDHGQHVRQALAEALAIVEHGRSQQGRRTILRAIMEDPMRAEPWLRALIVRLGTER